MTPPTTHMLPTRELALHFAETIESIQRCGVPSQRWLAADVVELCAAPLADVCDAHGVPAPSWPAAPWLSARWLPAGAVLVELLRLADAMRRRARDGGAPERIDAQQFAHGVAAWVYALAAMLPEPTLEDRLE